MKCIQDLERGRVIEGTITHEFPRSRFTDNIKMHLKETVLGHVGLLSCENGKKKVDVNVINIFRVL